MTSPATSQPNGVGGPRDKSYAGFAAKVARAHPEAAAVIPVMFGLLSTHDAAMTLLSRRMARESLTVPGFNVLMILGHGDAEYPMHRLGELLLVSRANVTGLVDSLERKGFVDRRENPRDRRGKLVRITASGRDLLARILPDHFRTLKTVLDALPSQDLQHLTRLLGELRSSFEQALAREPHA